MDLRALSHNVLQEGEMAAPQIPERPDVSPAGKGKRSAESRVHRMSAVCVLYLLRTRHRQAAELHQVGRSDLFTIARQYKVSI